MPNIVGAQIAAQRHSAADERRDLDAGYRAHALEDALQSRPRCSCWATVRTDVGGERPDERPDAHRQDIARIDPEVHAGHAGKARQEQSRPDEQDDGECDFER